MSKSWASLFSGNDNTKTFSAPVTSTNPAPPVKVDKSELTDLSAAANRLWDLDDNRLQPGRDYVINLQGGTKVYKTTDEAPDPLFTRLDEKIFQKPTFRTFISLLDNYTKETGASEVVTAEEERENREFIDAIYPTRPIQYLKEWLIQKGLSTAKTDKDFRRELLDLWFQLFSKDARNDSSSFEHVFVGEVRHGKVSGFHNWIQLYLEEKKGNIDYRGWILPRTRGRVQRPNSDQQLLSIQFSWGTQVKNVSSSFIGVSPEFEVALYTMCYLAGSEDNDLDIEEYQANIKCHHFKGKLGSAYPIARCD